MFTESTTSDASEHASQSVPMVTTSTGTLSTTNETAAGDDGDEVFVEAESEGYDLLCSFCMLSIIVLLSKQIHQSVFSALPYSVAKPKPMFEKAALCSESKQLQNLGLLWRDNFKKHY